MQFEDLEVDSHFEGFVPGQAGQIKPVGTDACNVTYRLSTTLYETRGSGYEEVHEGTC